MRVQGRLPVVGFVTPVGFKVSLSVILVLILPAPLRLAPDLGLGLGQGVSMLLGSDTLEVLVLDGVDAGFSVDSSSPKDPLLGEELRIGADLPLSLPLPLPAFFFECCVSLVSDGVLCRLVEVEVLLLVLFWVVLAGPRLVLTSIGRLPRDRPWVTS